MGGGVWGWGVPGWLPAVGSGAGRAWGSAGESVPAWKVGSRNSQWTSTEAAGFLEMSDRPSRIFCHIQFFKSIRPTQIQQGRKSTPQSVGETAKGV